ncbi:MAG: hypothetical protein AUG45_12515 [Ktedonobacter sp. 13_1_20CM_3_54_15]|nr:MAG: hypothetical protein AUH05_06650 [Ktedonobacter sp. 13_2_20CM_53_11]OLE03096.1 MAG: hypothetical protein AUG82_07105 [Ktedonobacter sp. 13_1_20CM_4_53_11]OLE31606.1 MAG: hypothetical protein AUG45_12515 [Ktedonobacter sp. 13_1_20CM_3_54_15]
MRLQGNGPKVARERLAIDICLPSLGHIQFVGIAQGCELRLPDVEEIPQGEGTNLWGLYMDHAIAGMRVQPAQAGTIWCNPDPLGNSDGLPIKGEGQMGMDVKDGLFHLITAMPSIAEYGALAPSSVWFCGFAWVCATTYRETAAVMSITPMTTLTCGGYLVYLFSKRPLSLNEQHERHAGSFPVRPQSHLQRCAQILSSQAHVSTQSAIRKRGSHLPGFLARACDGVSEEECFTELVHLQ